LLQNELIWNASLFQIHFIASSFIHKEIRDNGTEMSLLHTKMSHINYEGAVDGATLDFTLPNSESSV
jgi:hypothetical protein